MIQKLNFVENSKTKEKLKQKKKLNQHGTGLVQTKQWNIFNWVPIVIILLFFFSYLLFTLVIRRGNFHR